VVDVPDDDLAKDDIKLYTTEQVAELCEVTTETIRNWINDGLLKAVKLNNVFRVKRVDLIEFLNSRYV
jgi:excisionase family DNA binding protein